MRILLVNNLWPPVCQGEYELLASQVANELERRGHLVRVLTSDHQARGVAPDPQVQRTLKLTTDQPLAGEDFCGISELSLGALQKVAKHNRERTRQALNGFQADLVFGWCLDRLGLGHFFAGRERGVALAWSIHDEHPRQYRFLRLPKSVDQAARWIHQRMLRPLSNLSRLGRLPMAIGSQTLKQRLLDQKMPVEMAQVIPRGIDLDRFPYQPLSRGVKEPLRILYAGRLESDREVHTIIQALAQVDGNGPGQGGVRLNITGRGSADYQRRLWELRGNLGLQNEVRMVGGLDPAQMPGFYQGHHVLVCGVRLGATLGLAPLEAMASGCVVVGADRGAEGELLHHQENALVYRAGDPEHLAAQLRGLLGSEEMRRRLALGGRRWVEKHHAFSGYVNRLERFMNYAREGVP